MHAAAERMAPGRQTLYLAVRIELVGIRAEMVFLRVRGNEQQRNVLSSLDFAPARQAHILERGALATGTNKLWQATCEAIGCPDLAADPRFATPALRAQNQDSLQGLLEAEFSNHGSEKLLELFNGRGIPCAPLYTYSEILADTQVAHMGWLADLALPNGISTRTVVSPQKVSGRGLGVYRRPPALGEHTDEVLAELKSGSPA